MRSHDPTLSLPWFAPGARPLTGRGAVRMRRIGCLPQGPKIRIEGPAGAQIGYSVTYFDGKDSIDATGTVKVIPESGVYSEDLKNGHQAVLVEVIPSHTVTIGKTVEVTTMETKEPVEVSPSSTATVAVILLGWHQGNPASHRTRGKRDCTGEGR